jgi:hypothetical protein
MDRRQRKREKDKKKRELAKKKARAALARRPDPEQLILRAAARSPFGPCYVSVGWDLEEGMPELVSVVVTRRLPDGDLVPGTALVDRTCLGIKSAFAVEKVTEDELADFVEDFGAAHSGMEPCEPLIAQSVVYHALDYAHRLGFAPDPDFPESLFGPRPAELIETPWHSAAKPIYMRGPRDDDQAILAQLTATLGADGFTYVDDIALGDAGALDLEGFDIEGMTLDEDDAAPEPDDAAT